jgi:hypothetical protein
LVLRSDSASASIRWPFGHWVDVCNRRWITICSTIYTCIYLPLWDPPFKFFTMKRNGARVEWFAAGTERRGRPASSLLRLFPFPCLLNTQLTVARAGLLRLSTQSMPLIWPPSNPTQKIYSSSCLT